MLASQLVLLQLQVRSLQPLQLMNVLDEKLWDILAVRLELGVVIGEKEAEVDVSFDDVDLRHVVLDAHMLDDLVVNYFLVVVPQLEQLDASLDNRECIVVI